MTARDANEANVARAMYTVDQAGVDDRVDVHSGDIEQLEFDDESYDIVIVER